MTIALGFIGMAVSVFVQVIKVRYNFSKPQTLMLVAGISFVGAVAFKLLTHYGLWEAFWAIVVSAGAIYAFILKHVFKTGGGVDNGKDVE